jgi:hypothetical protein
VFGSAVKVPNTKGFALVWRTTLAIKFLCALLLTQNTVDFERIPGLSIEDWLL